MSKPKSFTQAMSPDARYTLYIDATSPQGEGLLGVLSRLLLAATPNEFGFEHVTLFIPDTNTTDWPEARWLTLAHHNNAGGDDLLTDQSIQSLLDQHPDVVLLSMNTVRFTHDRSIVLMNDAAAATLSNESAPHGFLQRLKEKIIARAQMPRLESASGIMALSCYAIAQTSSLNKMQHLIPLGISPEFFSSLREHRLIGDVAIDHPFVWLTTADPASDSLETAIDAVHILRDYGACIELKIIVPSPDEAHERGQEFTRSLEQKIQSRSYVEIIDAHDPPTLASHYREADGFIWVDRSDHSHGPLLRAMASALPVVAPNSEMVKRHLGGKVRFFLHGDANDLANTLERSMADIHFRIIGSSRNHKRSMSYTFEKTASELFRVVRAYAAADLGAAPVIETSPTCVTTH